MDIERSEVIRVISSEDVVRIRQLVREWAIRSGFNLVEQTKIVTGASEIARNTVNHGGGGTLLVEAVNNGSRRGIRLTFEDKGPGIADL